MEITNNEYNNQKINNEQILYPEEVYEYIQEEIPGQIKEYGHFLIRRRNYQLYESGLYKTKGILKTIKKNKNNYTNNSLRSGESEKKEKNTIKKRNFSAKFLKPCKTKTFYTNYLQKRYSYANYDIPDRCTKTRKIISEPYQPNIFLNFNV